jgi:hypothetical protein
MRRLIISLAVGLLACASALAGPKYIQFEITTGAATTATNTQTKVVSGFIEEAYVEVCTGKTTQVSGVATAIVTLVSNPDVGNGLTPTVLYTNATMSAKVFARPRVTPTDNAGSALTNLTVRERFFCIGDPVTFRVAQSSGSSNITYRAFLKVND